MKKQGSSVARRKLNFKEKPWFDKIFYIDVRSENVKSKIAKRIKELGGHIEGFLTKDIHLLITDKTKNDIERQKKSRKENQHVSTTTQNSFGMPLSRGRALLLKANQGKSQNSNNNKNGNDIINNASLLGVKVQQVNMFLKETRKVLQEFRQFVGINEDGNDSIDGVSPLRWKDSNKENRNVMKIEDSSQLFKPMLKHLDDFPLIRYSDQLISPFDKGVTLCRKSEVKPNRYSTKTKTTVKVHKGGFCEACDYWYKCSLREHLNSEKHQKFVRDTKNFKNLDEIISKMPCLSDFIGKYLPGNSNLKPSSLTENSVPGNHGNKLELSSKNISIAESACVPDKMDVIVMSNTDCEEFVDVENVSCSTSKSSLLLKNPGFVVSEKEKAPGQISAEESEMEIDIIPAISKDLLNDDSMDSGTGPEMPDELSRDSIACIESLDDTSRQATKNGFKRSNSDSALPPDVNEGVDNDIIMNSCSTNLELQDSSCDTAMFLCLRNSQGNVPVDQATTNVRKKLSSFSIHESSHSRDGCNLNSNFTGNETLQISSQLIRSSCDILNSDLQEDSLNVKSDHIVHTDSEKTELYYQNPVCNKSGAVMPLLTSAENTADKCNGISKMPILDKFDFSPQKNESSNHNASFVDVASLWMNDICGQDSVKKVENDTLPSTIKFSKESSFNLNSENGGSVFKPVKFITNTNKTSSEVDCEKNCERRKIVNDPVYSDICGSENSDDVFQTIQNPFTLQNSELTESLDMSNKSSVISRPTLSSTSSNVSNFDTKSNDCTSLINANSLTPKTPSSFFRPWLEDCGSENSISKSKRKKMNLSAADMGWLLKEVKKSTCKKNKSKGRRRRKPVEEIMNDNKNNKIVYSCQQNGTKLRLSKVSSTPVENQPDLHNYWKVRKSSGCRLVFSANKRKHSDTTEDENKNSEFREMPVQKRRRCLAF